MYPFSDTPLAAALLFRWLRRRQTPVHNLFFPLLFQALLFFHNKCFKQRNLKRLYTHMFNLLSPLFFSSKHKCSLPVVTPYTKVSCISFPVSFLDSQKNKTTYLPYLTTITRMGSGFKFSKSTSGIKNTTIRMHMFS